MSLGRVDPETQTTGRSDVGPHSPIVVLDSGLGGLTVARALRQLMPDEDILYFADTARLPYGSKAAATVTTFVQQIVGYLRPYDPKHVLIACSTATAVALPSLRATFPDLSISGVIEPGARAAVEAAGAKPAPIIGVIATDATIRSRAFERAIIRRRKHARLLLNPTPLLVPIIEEGRRGDDPLVELALSQYLRPMVERGMDVLVLGCTHYPILKTAIEASVGPGVKVIDSAEQCAQDVARRLRARGLARADSGAEDAKRPGSLKAFVSDDPERFKRLTWRLLGLAIDTPTWVSPDELYRPLPAQPMRISVPA